MIEAGGGGAGDASYFLEALDAIAREGRLANDLRLALLQLPAARLDDVVARDDRALGRAVHVEMGAPLEQRFVG